MTLRKLVAEPLLHFFLIGALLFVLYGWLNENQAGGQEEIIVTTATIKQIEESFQSTWQRPPTAQETEAMIEAWVREEILYRQGVAIGFDQGDPVIRRRVAQKMTFIADGVAPEPPTDEVLATWLQENIETYELAPRFSFEQVYINPQQYGAGLDAYLAGTLAALQGGADKEDLGDSIMLPGQVAAAAPRDIERTFGLDFAAAIADLEPGSWQGPVVSGFGLHFVRLQDVIPGREPGLDEVREEVERDYLEEQSEKISESFFDALRERYTVVIEPRDSGS